MENWASPFGRDPRKQTLCIKSDRGLHGANFHGNEAPTRDRRGPAPPAEARVVCARLWFEGGMCDEVEAMQVPFQIPCIPGKQADNGSIQWGGRLL